MRNVAIGLLVVTTTFGACATEIIGTQDYLAKAAEHAGEAVDHGKEGHAYALSRHAEVALRYAEIAQKDLKGNAHIEKGIQELNKAILQGRADDVVEGTKSAENAYKHFKAAGR